MVAPNVVRGRDHGSIEQPATLDDYLAGPDILTASTDVVPKSQLYARCEPDRVVGLVDVLYADYRIGTVGNGAARENPQGLTTTNWLCFGTRENHTIDPDRLSDVCESHRKAVHCT